MAYAHLLSSTRLTVSGWPSARHVQPSPPGFACLIRDGLPPLDNEVDTMSEFKVEELMMLPSFRIIHYWLDDIRNQLQTSFDSEPCIIL